MPDTPPPDGDDLPAPTPTPTPTPAPPSASVFAAPDATAAPPAASAVPPPTGWPGPGQVTPWAPPAPVHPAPQPAAPARGTDGFAVAAFVLSLVAVVVVAVVLAVVALVRIRRSGQGGRGLAVAALAVSGAWVVVGALVATLALVAASSDDRNSAVAPVRERERVLVSDLAPGDCVEREPEDGELRRVTVVPCEQPHAVEAYVGFDLPAGPYPGDRQVAADAEEGCEQRIPERVLEATGADGFMYLYPSRENWGDDRAVLCLLVFDTPRVGLSPR